MNSFSVENLLQVIAQYEGQSGNTPVLIFLDTLGNKIAASKPQAAFEFEFNAEGFLNAVNLPDDQVYKVCSVEIYGKAVGFLAVVLHKGNAHCLESLAMLATTIVGFAAEKNFELDDLSAALNRLFEEKSFLYEITAELGDSFNLADFCVRLARRVAGILEAPRAVVLLTAQDKSEYRVVGAFGLDSDFPDSLPIEAGISGQVMQSGKLQLIEEVSSQDKKIFSALELEARRCLLVAPLMSGTSSSSMGALCVMDGGRSGSFTSEEAKLLSFIAEYVTSVISGLHLLELKKEVQIAQRIIDGLLPDKAPQVSGFTLSARLSPARVVGGDYYDYLSMIDNHTGVVIADVSGHTLPATLLVTVARAAFHWAASDSLNANPAEILHTVCKRLYSDLSSAEFFMSIFLLVLGQDREVRFSNAGHPPAILYRAKSQTFEELDTEGMVAGILQEIDFEEKTTKLQENDVLVLYTDGITEIKKPGTEEMFGMQRLQAVIAAASAFPVDEIIEAIFQEAAKYGAGEIEDDLTVIVIKGAPIEQTLANKTAKAKGTSI